MSRHRRGRRRNPAAIAGGAAVLLLVTLLGVTPGALGGYSASIGGSTGTAGTATYFKCADAIAAPADKAAALFQWPLNDTTAANGTAAVDVSGNARNGTHVGGTTTDATAPLACPRDAGTSWALDGATQYAYSGVAQTPSNTFTIEVWFKTSAAQGRLIGLGSSTTGVSTYYDRHLYINSSGFLVFGVFPGAFKTLTTPTTVTDNAWHYAAASLSGAGMALYLDGRLVGSDATTTTAQGYVLANGYWRVGYDTLATWPGAPASAFFKGRMRFAAVYTSALSAAQIARHYAAGV